MGRRREIATAGSVGPVWAALAIAVGSPAAVAAAYGAAVTGGVGGAGF